MHKASLFVSVVRHGSFSRAADALGVGRSTISEHIRSLEDALEVRLLQRTTRKLATTEEGQLLYEQMSLALAAWGDVCAAFDERRAEPAGHLRVGCPTGLGESLVGPALCELLTRYPKVTGEVVSSDAIADLHDGRVDLSVRMAPLTDRRLVARKVGETQCILVCSEGHSERWPHLEDLERSPWIGHSEVALESVQLHTRSGERLIHPVYRALANSSLGQNTLIEGGVGVAMMPEMLVKQAIDAGRMRHVFPDVHGRTLPIYVVYPAKRFLPARMLRFIDMVVKALTTEEKV